jgi:hypothetical protein
MKHAIDEKAEKKKDRFEVKLTNFGLENNLSLKKSTNFCEDIITLIDTKSVNKDKVNSIYQNRFQEYKDENDFKPFFNFKLSRNENDNNEKINSILYDDPLLTNKTNTKSELCEKNASQNNIIDNNDAENARLRDYKIIKTTHFSNKVNQNKLSRSISRKKDLVIVSRLENNIFYSDKELNTSSSITTNNNKFKSNTNYLKFHYKIATGIFLKPKISESNYLIESYDKTNRNNNEITNQCNRTSFIMKRRSFSNENYIKKNFDLNTRIPIKYDSNLKLKKKLVLDSNKVIVEKNMIDETYNKFKLFLKNFLKIQEPSKGNMLEDSSLLSTKVDKDYDVEFKFMKKTDINNKIFFKKYNYSTKFRENLKIFDLDASLNNEMVYFFILSIILYFYLNFNLE